MRRQVHLIAGLGDNNDQQNSIKNYLQQYSDYFSSIAGGAWDASEIIYHQTPSLEKLNEALVKENLDFAIVVMIGHGAVKNDLHIFKLNENEIIHSGQLYTNSNKHIIILESCRCEIQNINTVDLKDKIPKFEHGGIVRSPITRELAKQLYFNSISNCVNDHIVCFACDINQTANNFYFSYGLLQTCMNWHLTPQPHRETLGINKIMNHLNSEINKLSRNQIGESQNPTINGFANFPFAVGKF